MRLRLHTLIYIFENDLPLGNMVLEDEPFIELYNNYRTSLGEEKASLKVNIIERLYEKLAGLDYKPEPFIDESKRMWEELAKTGYSKSDLDNNDYPLSQKNGYNSCALCNFAFAVSSRIIGCDKCPIDWTDGTCHELFFQWRDSCDIDSKKYFANKILNEISK